MPVHNRKLPADAVLIQHVSDGMTLDQVAARYGATKDYVRKNLRRLGVAWSLDESKPLVEIRTIGKTIVERRVSGGEYGGVAVIRISLPCISMHQAYLANPNGHPAP